VAIWNVLRETYKEWKDDNASQLAASLSYYTAVAIAPLLVLLVTVIGWFYGLNSAQVELIARLRGMVGPQAAEVAQAVIESADQPDVATGAGIISFLVLLWGASNVFVQLQNSLDIIWGVELKPSTGFMATIKERFLSFGMILVIGFLLLVSLILSAVLSAANGAVRDFLPGMDLLWEIVNFVVSFGVTTLLFALIYKVLPDAQIGWREVWVGATVTALLFTIGKWLLGIYFGYTSTSSAYGAAGSLMVLLIWIYYSAQIFFFGAEYTQVYASTYGKGIIPDEKAQYADPQDRAEAKATGAVKG
jgi:membrane protein